MVNIIGSGFGYLGSNLEWDCFAFHIAFNTLSYLPTPLPVCPSCKVQLTTKHILLNCNNLKHIRTKYYQARNLSDIFKNTNPENIFNFLKKTQLFQQDITKHLYRTATLMAEIQNNLFGIKWPTAVDMPLNKTQTQLLRSGWIWHKVNF